MPTHPPDATVELEPLALASVGLAKAPTPLSRRLEVHADARRAFDLARDLFVTGQRIDMRDLAATLGVDRTSLFRWVGNRDALLSEVLWSIAVPTLIRADRATADRGGTDGVTEFLTHFAADLIGAAYFRDFLRREPSRALRLLTTNASEIQRRFQLTVDLLLRRELGDRPLGGVIDSMSLAFLLVRIWESFTYADLIAGETPCAERARVAFQLVLRVAPGAA